MEEKYRLKKEYKISSELFNRSYLELQKRFVLPKSRLYTAIFAVLAVGIIIFGIFVMKDATTKQKYMIYLGFAISCAFAVKEWYDPKKMRRNLTESIKALGEPLYCVGIADKYVDIATVADDLSNIPEEEREKAAEEDPLPEKTRINIDENFQLIEQDDYFMLMKGREMFYVLPKEYFSGDELDIIRSLKK